ncbi:MAG: 4-alpha-glucanotransferase [Paludibacter sp.]|nr:4-alpha-glucanotransferase [Paludibacter sp.]
MKIHFKISYFTVWGQQILVSGNIPELGNGDITKALRLNFSNIQDWVGEININYPDSGEIKYKYLLFTEQTGRYTEEWGQHRTVTADTTKTDHFFCYDSWNSPASVENTFLTAPFATVLLREEHDVNIEKPSGKFSHIFRIEAPGLPKNQVVCIIGNCKELGNWSTIKPRLLMINAEGAWETELSFGKLMSDVHYKYGTYDLVEKKFCAFESGPDRIAPVFNSKKTIVRLADGFIRVQAQPWRGAGVGLPVFSIRTKKSLGVGDFGDMLLFIDWAKRVGIKLIQVLPLNDTIGTHTDADVLPYAAISAFALNPLFLNLPAIGKLHAKNPMQKEFEVKQAELNEQELIPFMDVINLKTQYVKELYQIQKEEFLNNTDYKTFFIKNKFWLVPYSAYCVLRDRNKTPDYRVWKEFSKFDALEIDEFTSPEQLHYDAIAVNYFIQYHLHVQLSKAANYAHQQGVVLKGDVPIGVNRNSVDTWVSPELFHMHCQAGAPPDMFAVKGQNWELPTYNWDEIKRTGFDWWKKRFAQMSNYFDAFRIDHILGFFRIWEIPVNQAEGIMGHLNPSIPIHLREFAEKGLWFDYNRYCKPYITDIILHDIFGEDVLWVKTNCLQIENGWVLQLKTPFQSQTYVEKLFNEGTISEKIKWGLFDLISNVLFFEVEESNGSQFYPRYGMEGLPTFRDLDGYTQSKLRELYVDYFYRRQDEHWYHSGMEKLPALKRATNMLICGEDLGMMTHCVTTVMNELGILSLEVQRAPKSDKLEFFHPVNAPYLSVVTPSTHDMSTIRGWWEEDRAMTQRFYNSQLGHWGEAPWFCDGWICRDILLQHLYSPAMWAVFQMQDLLSISEAIRRENPHDERINVPSNSKFSWRFRLHLNMEDLIENDAFNDELKNYIFQSGR